MYFLSTACGRPQRGGGPAHVDRGREGVENRIFCGRRKWMAPNESDGNKEKLLKVFVF